MTTEASPTTPTASLPPTPLEALSPCREDQLRLTAGADGAAAGSAYLTVFVELTRGPRCSISGNPLIAVRSEDGREIARAAKTEPRMIALTYVTRYYVEWSSGCGPMPTGARVATVEFSANVVIDLPIGMFGPSCVDGAGQEISMYADEPAS